jgi:hypothetical protein
VGLFLTAGYYPNSVTKMVGLILFDLKFQDLCIDQTANDR